MIGFANTAAHDTRANHFFSYCVLMFGMTINLIHYDYLKLNCSMEI